jgi:glycosyltransferase involved in cell wall biosynthesis
MWAERLSAILWRKRFLLRSIKAGISRNRRDLRFLVCDRLSNLLLRVAVVLGSPITRLRLWFGRPRSVWGITPILTITLKARCDRLLGISAESLVLSQYYISHEFDRNLARLANRVVKADCRLYQPFCRALLAVALLRYDIFHYFADQGFLQPETTFGGINPEELSALRAAGKRLYIFAYGADVRTRARTIQSGRWNMCIDCPAPGTHCVCDTDRADRALSAAAKMANAVVTMGDMTQYVSGGWRLDYWPIDTDRIQFQPHAPGPVLRVAHAPNHAFFKGTRYLIEAIDRLRAEGEPIELVMVQGVPNHEVLRVFASATVIAEQFVAGSFGYTMLEGMALGRPVLCLIRASMMPTAPEECPFINANPDTLYDALRWCLRNRARLAEIGRAGRRYVERHHSLAAVARRFAELYIRTGDFPNRVNRSIAVRSDNLAGRIPPALRLTDLAVMQSEPAEIPCGDQVRSRIVS